MCGIGGQFFRHADAQEIERSLSRLQASLSHRGPDGKGQVVVDAAGLAQTRLAIIDLETGQQPLWNHDRSLVIVLNGEIYNYRELRARFERGGARFTTKSDTEVILAAYRAEGISAFAQLRGMYAFALWDRAARRGYLVRDPLGIKPLFVRDLADGGLCFASEAKGIYAMLADHPKLDPGALHLLLNFRYLPGTNSLFTAVRQLAPGEILEWDATGEHRARVALRPGSSERSLHETLTGSVAAHLVADVPVGCYLSGGIDSGVVAAIAHAKAGNALTSFTLNVGDDPNEARNAAATAAALKLRNVQGALDAGEVPSLAQQLWHLEVPKVNAVQLFEIARLARREVKVVLSGLGGDELFCGYNAHRIFGTLSRVSAKLGDTLPAMAGRVLASLCRMLSVPNGEPERAMAMAAASGDWPRIYGLLRNVWDSPPLRRWLYGERMLDADLPDAFAAIRERWIQAESPLGSMLAYEWREKMVNDLLWQEDRASMANGVEVRTPFVDVDVYADVTSHGAPLRTGKIALREVAAMLLPPGVLTRPKSGFQLNAPVYFHTRLAELSRQWLSPEQLRRHGLFNPVTVAKLLALPPRRRYRWHFFMLMLMMQTHMWLEIFENGQTPAALPT